MILVDSGPLVALFNRHFTTYRIQRGYHQIPFTIIGDPSGPRFVREGVGGEVDEEPAHTP